MVQRKKRKQTTDAVEILHRRYYQGHSLAMLNRIAMALNRRIEIDFVPVERRRRSA